MVLHGHRCRRRRRVSGRGPPRADLDSSSPTLRAELLVVLHRPNAVSEHFLDRFFRRVRPRWIFVCLTKSGAFFIEAAQKKKRARRSGVPNHPLQKKPLSVKTLRFH